MSKRKCGKRTEFQITDKAFFSFLAAYFVVTFSIALLFDFML